jgi:excisionase family DNA binding protein
MQASTANTQHDRGSPVPSIPPELLETVARALAAALVPPPRQPEPPGTDAPDFLTAAQLAVRLGVSRQTVRRLAIAGALPHTVVCRGGRKTTRRFPRRVGRARTADLRSMPGPASVPGLRDQSWDHPRHLGWPGRPGTPATANPACEHCPAGA